MTWIFWPSAVLLYCFIAGITGGAIEKATGKKDNNDFTDGECAAIIFGGLIWPVSIPLWIGGFVLLECAEFGYSFIVKKSEKEK